MNNSPSPELLKKAKQFHRSILFSVFFSPIRRSVRAGITDVPYLILGSYFFSKTHSPLPLRIMMGVVGGVLTSLLASVGTEIVCDKIDNTLSIRKYELSKHLRYKYNDQIVKAIERNADHSYYENKFIRLNDERLTPHYELVTKRNALFNELDKDIKIIDSLNIKNRLKDYK